MKTLCLSMVLFFFDVATYGCSCGRMGIEREVTSAYDIVIGKIVSENEETNDLTYYKDNKRYGATTTYAYTMNVEFSYKRNLSGLIKVFGGKGYGDCGAILFPGFAYLIAIYKSDEGYCSFLWDVNVFLPHADYEINFLNQYFNKKYERLNMDFLIPVVLLSLSIASTAVAITFRYYNLPTNVFRRRAWASS